MKLFYKVSGVVIALVASFVFGAFFGPLDIESYLATPRKEVAFPVLEHKPFVIVVPSSQNSEWVEKNLSSIFAQRYDNYRVVYIDDATLRVVEECVERHQMGHRVKVVHNESISENIYHAVHACSVGEIVVILDGSDWFPHEHVLERLNEIYADPQVWLTYGSYIEYPSYANFTLPLPKRGREKIMERGLMPTFYASLYNKIAERDLFQDDSYEQAMMVPMAEMAGAHAKYVKEALYVHNRAALKDDQKEVAKRILDLPRYKPIDSLEEKTL